MAAWLDEFWRVSREADLLIYSPVATPAWSVAQRLGIPGVAAYLQPLHPTREFPTAGMAHFPTLGGSFNWATHLLAHQLAWLPLRGRINTWRREILSLPPASGLGPLAPSARADASLPTLYAFSPLVVPKPADWDDSIRITGYWVLEPAREWQPPELLERFLQAGPPPVYIGFGSMTPRESGRLTAMAVAALSASGQRGVLLDGWGTLGAGALPSTVIAIGDVPHEWLLPRMAAVVHHGGAGTTGAALRSGVPSIVVPLGFDQPFWGARVHALGVGPPPISRRSLTAERLASAITQAVTNGAMRERAARLGSALRKERGVETAVEELDAIVVRARAAAKRQRA